MIIFLYGPDDYRREQNKRELMAEFQKKYPEAGYEFFDSFETDSLEKFQNFVKNQSMFVSFKLGIIEGLPKTANNNFAKDLKKLINREEITVILSAKEKSTKEFNFLKEKPVLSRQFEYLKGGEYKNFIQTEVKKENFNLTDSALNFLAQIFPNDTWRLITEIKRIGLFGKETVDKKDLENLDIAPSGSAEIDWGVLNGLKSLNMAERLWSLESLFAKNEPAQKIFYLSAYGRKEKLPLLAAYDLAIKSGKMDYEEALVDLAIN